jgi:hypothetical protein
MTETQVEQTVATLRDRSIGASPSIILREALDAQIPRGVRRYIIARVAAWLAEDFKHSPRFVKMNFAGGGDAELTATFSREIAAGVELKRKEFLDLLKEAVIFTERYLTRPRWTLVQILSDESQTVSLRDLHSRLAFCADYAYFERLLENVIARRSTKEISVEELTSLVHRIDDQVVQQHAAGELALLAKPIFDLLLLHDAGPDESIPLSAVLTFFEDKNMKILKEYIESICRIRKSTTITLTSLALLIEKLGTSGEGGAAEASGLKGFTPSTENDQTAAGQIAETVQPGTPEPVQVPSVGEVRAGGDPSHPDIRSFMTESQQHRFIRRVFSKDESLFSSVVAALNSMDSWGEASSYLAGIYRRNRLDPFAEDVVEFTDLVQRRFSSFQRSGHEVH